MQTFKGDWSLKDKINFLQRKVILNCIAYYELDWDPISDDYYKDLVEQLIELQIEFSRNEDDDIGFVTSETNYGYVTHDIDVSTGFDLYHNLTKEDQEYLMSIALDVYNKEQGVVDIKKTEKKPFLYEHQKEAIEKMHNGCILNGGVGSGKSRTALAYYHLQNDGKLEPFEPMKGIMGYPPDDLYIITTAKKRDTLEWEGELAHFLLSTNPKNNTVNGNKIVIDSWNNIKKYADVKGAFFIFDEDRVTGNGVWVKSFLKIAKNNRWILLSATPGDTWQDYIPVFVANSFYKNRTEFLREHVIYSRFAKYPKIDRYVNTGRLIRLRNKILVDMDFERHTIQHHEDIYVPYDTTKYKQVTRTRWNPYKDEPITNAGGLCYVWRRIVNSDESRQVALLEIFEKHPRMIVFYSFDYERDILLNLYYGEDVEVAEWSGHKHQPIPDSKRWVYIVNYTGGCEGWNCIETDCVVFYSQTYSWKTLQQATGRIDRLNTPYIDLYYYHLKSRSGIDLAISKALREKKNFNENRYVRRFSE